MPAKGVQVPHGTDIRIEGVRLALGDDPPMPVLGGVDLHVPAGTVAAIVGPSGCGKSTLLDVVAGLAAPDAGSISGADSVALMPQRDALMPWLTLRANIALGAELAGAPRDDVGRGADEAIARLGLTGFADHYPHALSGGMRQRAALARTLLAARPAWLLDEPFGALDALTRTGMHDVLRDLMHEVRPTVLLVTHDIAEAVALADRVLVAGPRPMAIVADIDAGPGADPAHTADAVMTALRSAGALA